MFDDWDLNTWAGFAIIGIVPLIIMWIFAAGIVPLIYRIAFTFILPGLAWFFIERKK